MLFHQKKIFSFFQGNGTHCKDLDECIEGSYTCDFPHSKCINSVGSYTCGCEAGFRLDSAHSCSPVNMCQEPVCPESADCVYIGPGEYTCTCTTGYSQNGAECLRKYILFFYTKIYINICLNS